MRTPLIFFPGALGDFLCFLPAAAAIQRSSGQVLRLVTHTAYAALLDPSRFATLSIERREVAALFQARPAAGCLEFWGNPEIAISWTGAGDPHFRRNLLRLCPSAAVFPFRDFAPGEHASAYYERCAGFTSNGVASLHLTAADHTWARIATAGGPFLAIHPGSGSPRKNWRGMAELTRRCRQRGQRIAVISGAADGDAAAGIDADFCIADQSLSRVAAVLARADYYVGNDSGISHLAAATGCAGLALFADSDAGHWRPMSKRIRVVRAADSCRLCAGDRFCTHRIGVGDVLALVPGDVGRGGRV